MFPLQVVNKWREILVYPVCHVGPRAADKLALDFVRAHFRGWINFGGILCFKIV